MAFGIYLVIFASIFWLLKHIYKGFILKDKVDDISYIKENETSIICENCHAKIDYTSKFCTHCGSKVSYKVSSKKEYKCSNCNFTNNFDNKFCVNCGEELQFKKYSNMTNTDKYLEKRIMELNNALK